MKEKKGSYLLGFIGAILGTIVAMIPFIIVFKLGYIVFWLAFLFITLASVGYDLLGGRKGFLKTLIIILVGFVGVLLAVFFEDLWFIYNENILEMYGLSVIDIPALIMEAMKHNQEYGKAIVTNLLLSLGAYFVGVILYIISTIKEHRAQKKNQQNLNQYSEESVQNQELNMANSNSADFSGSNQTMTNSTIDNTGLRRDENSSSDMVEETNEIPEESYYREEEEARRPE